MKKETQQYLVDTMWALSGDICGEEMEPYWKNYKPETLEELKDFDLCADMMEEIQKAFNVDISEPIKLVKYFKHWNKEILENEEKERDLYLKERYGQLLEVNPFVKWAVDKYSTAEDSGDVAFADNPKGDFVYDMGDDSTFPLEADFGKILGHLHSRRACEGALEAFRELWTEYIDETKRETCF